MLIGLGHSARVGKDTCAQLLGEAYGFERIAFADSLRDFVYRTHPDIAALVDRWGWEQAKLGYEHVRKRLVDTGHEARRIMGDDVWIRAAFRRMNPSRHTVITDVRYPNEAAAVKAEGGLLVKVTRPGVEPLPNIADRALADFDGWDCVVVNDGTIEELRLQLADIAGREALCSSRS